MMSSTNNTDNQSNGTLSGVIVAAEVEEDPLKAPKVEEEEVVVDDDDLQDLLKEAETLMHDIDDGPPNNSTRNGSEEELVFEGFSIDDSDDEDGGKAATTAGTGIATGTGAVEDHPLSDVRLSSAPTPSPKNNNNINNIINNNINNNIAGAQHGSGMATMNMNMNMNMNMANANLSVDVLKQQTSRFASGLASMAQRAANQVAAATAPVQVTTGTPVGGGGGHLPPSTTSSSTSPHQQSFHYNFNQSLAAATAPSTPSTPGSNMNATPTPTATAATANGSSKELDKEQKASLLKEHFGDLLKGERVIMFLSHLIHVSDTCGLSYVASSQSSNNSSNAYMWCCVMTYYRLLFFSTCDQDRLVIPCPPDWSPSCWPKTPLSTKTLEIPLATMDRVEKTVYQAGGSSYMGIIVYSKDCGRIIRFTTPSHADTGRAFEALNMYAFPGRRNLGYLFAFESRRQEVMASVQMDQSTGQQSITLPPLPKRFDPSTEYPRLLQQTNITQSPWAIWSTINASYAISPTYPSVLVGPATLDETKPESQHIIKQCAQFRSESRLPALTWCSSGGASIWRSSQPKVGLQGNRSPADELFLRHIAESARGANAMADPPAVFPRSVLQQLTGDYSKDWVPEPGCGLKILDLRPRSSAMANRTGGYGYENTSNYTNSTIQFCNIQNIHAIRDSYNKLCTVCNSGNTADVNWNYLIEDTKWLPHIRTILAASWETAYWVHVWRLPVLLHCSHGWDRTSQVAAIAEILLDPYYRTLHGFSVLVEKDFMSFGHPFHTRCAHGEGRHDRPGVAQSQNDEGQISPIFLQFVDCVYQIVKLFPESFEYTTDYLLELSFHIYSCRFGSMLCDTEREREILAGIRQRTYSVWEYLEDNPSWRNPKYNDTSSEKGGVLLMPLSTLLRNISLWTERHCHYSPKSTRTEDI